MMSVQPKPIPEGICNHHVLFKMRSAALRRCTTAWHVNAALSLFHVKHAICHIFILCPVASDNAEPVIDMVSMHSITWYLVQHRLCIAVAFVTTVLCVTGRRPPLRARVALSSATMTELQQRPTKEL